MNWTHQPKVKDFQLKAYFPALLAGLLTLCSSLTLSACGPKNSPPTAGLQFEAGFPAEKKARIMADFEFLRNLQFGDSAHALKLKNILHLRDTSSHSFHNWMTFGLHVIVAPDFNVEERAYLKPYSNLNSHSNRNDQGAKVIMANLGAAVYIAAKSIGKTAILDVPGVGKIEVNSPLVGVIQEGEGLFSNIYSSSSFTFNETSYIIFRLGTFFHELMHEYGNQAAGTLGFTHIPCPNGLYAGRFACDQYINGPYMVGALFTLSYLDTCTKSTCSGRTRGELSIRAADYLHRIVTRHSTRHSFHGTAGTSQKLLERLENEKDPDFGDITPEKDNPL